MKRFLLIIAITFWAASAHAATWYVDCAVSSSGNGQSWATAWKNFNNITGLSAGDIVYISGSASCSTYSVSGWTVTNGTSGNPIAYSIGQDAGHNSPITINNSGNPWLSGSSGNITGVVITGNYNGTRSITVTNSTIVAGNTNGFKLAYINLDSPLGAGTVQNFELDHVYVDLKSGSDHFFTSSASAGSLGYTSNLVHDSTFRLRYRDGVNGAGGNGDDGFQWVENISFYNNQWVGVYDTGYSGSQHGDGIQTSGSYVAIYNNYFENQPNYMIYGEYYGNTSHWRIYNNVLNYSDATLTSQPSCGVALGCVGSNTITDITVANNTLHGGGRGISLGGGTPCAAVNSSYVVNNILHGTILELISYNGVNSNNVQGTSNISFVSSTDFHLQSTSTAVIDKGISPSYLTSVYTTDKDGVSRPQGAAWDIGAYEYVPGGIIAKPMPPALQLVN